MEEKNTAVIEQTAINKLKDTLLRTGFVDPDIKSNDTTPSWDGELRLYNSKSVFRKDNLGGRIPVQVKGKYVQRFLTKKATFQADVSDLRNYMNDGGAIFFLVQLKDFDDYRIYYNSLLPFDLRRLLEEAGNQSTKRIKLEPFPQRYVDGMLRILRDFLANREKQGKLIPDVFSIQDLEKTLLKIEKLESFVSSEDADNPDALFDEMLNRPQYVYAKLVDSDLSFVVDKISLDEVVIRKNRSVQVNGDVLYDHIDEVRLAGGEKHYKLGESITVTSSDKDYILNFTFRGSLSEQIKELKLMSYLMHQQNACATNDPRKTPALTARGYTAEDVDDRLSSLLRIDETLKRLHIKKDLNLGELSDEAKRCLDHLAIGILDDRPVSLSTEGKERIGKLILGNITVLLASKEDPAGSGYFIRDFFEVDDFVLYAEGMQPKDGCRVSPYVMLTPKLYQTVDNIDLSEVIPSIRRFPHSDLYHEKLILLCLELLKIFDEVHDARFLDIVIQLLEFLQTQDDSRDELYQINRLQAEKRRRKLTKDENQYLMTLKTSGIPVQYKLAACILLESFSEAQIIYDTLEEQEQSVFDGYPLMSLWKKE